MRIPLGESEGQNLEFKRRAALENPYVLSRAVVAMLSGSGGTIWIGMHEAREVAVRTDPIQDPRAERHRLWNRLVDTIEPPPLPDEVRVEVEAVDDDSGALLRVSVQPTDERRPYAYLKQGGRHFVVRFGARVRAMTREELFPRGAADHAQDVAIQTLLEERAEHIEGPPKSWVRVQPDRELELTLGEVEPILRDPSRTGNRRTGWTFINRFAELKIDQNRRILDTDCGDRTTVHRDGWVEYEAPLVWLWHSNPGQDQDVIYPLALIERTTSVLRLASALYRPAKPQEAGAFGAAVDVALFSAKGWKLRPYSPKASGYVLRHDERRVEDRDLLLERPLVFRSHELIEEPDRCAFRVICRLYEAFGYEEEMVPSEFDRETGRLVLPEWPAAN